MNKKINFLFLVTRVWVVVIGACLVFSNCVSVPKSDSQQGNNKEWEEFDEASIIDPSPKEGGEGKDSELVVEEGALEGDQLQEAPFSEGNLTEEKGFEVAEGEAFMEEAPPADAEEIPLDLDVPSGDGLFQKEQDLGANPSSSFTRIVDMEFIAEKGGGTVMVEASQTPSYRARFNERTSQFILEIFNSELPSRLTRPFNTKDFQSNIAFIKAYQTQEGNTHVVIQLRDGSLKPSARVEGNVILVSTGEGMVPGNSSSLVANEGEGRAGHQESTTSWGQQNSDSSGSHPNNKNQILSAHSLRQFLSSNNRFYGKKISVVTRDMPLKDFFGFVAEESGVNLILSKQIDGNVSLKLRDIPWDQALIVVMKANSLGYTRHGNILRIALLSDLRAEEEESQRLLVSKRKVEPLHVYKIPVSYANVNELTKNLQGFLSPRGKVANDRWTSSLLVTDIKERIENIEQLVRSLDVPPAQVFIEGKVVEAGSNFSSKLGINWNISGGSFPLSNSPTNKVNLSPELNIAPGGGVAGGGAFFAGISVGTFKNLGNINTFLSLNERKDQVKVISSPRIMTMNNEQASISQTTEVPIITSVNTAGTVTQSVTFKPVHLKLDVIPQVTSDDSVLLKVNVKREFLGGAISANDSVRPVNSRSAQTKVLVKNGETAVIGGILQSDVAQEETGVPFLKDIPFLGAFFRSKSQVKEKTELLIFLTPRIIYTPYAKGASASAHGGMGDDAESLERDAFGEEEGSGLGEGEVEGAGAGENREENNEGDPIFYEQSQ